MSLPRDSFNDITHQLVNLITSAIDSPVQLEAFNDLLKASAILYRISLNKKLSLDVTKTVLANHPAKVQATLLELTIIKNKPHLFNALLVYIFNHDFISKEEKRSQFISALCCAIILQQNHFLHPLLEIGGDINDVLVDWNYNNLRKPLNIAINCENVEAIKILVLNGAHITLGNLKSKLNDLNSPKNTRSPKKGASNPLPILICLKHLLLAENLYQDDALLHRHLSQAISLDVSFVSQYIKLKAELAILHLMSDTPSQHHYLLKFISVFILIIYLSKKYQAHLEPFQKDVILHLIGAYDCEQPTSNHTIKLFNSTEEKYHYFTAPIANIHPLKGFESTLSKMKESHLLGKNASASETSSTSLIQTLIASREQAGLLNAPKAAAEIMPETFSRLALN